MSWPVKKPEDPAARRYLEANRRRAPRSKERYDLSAVVIDAETTGFKPDRDRLLSVAAIEVKEGELWVSSAAEWLVFHEDAKINAATQVHGILPSESAAGESEAKVLAQLLDRMHSCLVVGHHIGFDMAMLSAAARRHFGISLKNRVLDTAALAMQELVAFRKTGYQNQRPPTLDEVCLQLGLPLIDRHTAIGDAFTTATVFLSLCARMRGRLGRELRWRDLPIA